ncbi:MAG: NAD(P)/FAD-dependent oxidoreductase [Cytophagales bacterium]|nr:NAD(P)/FAD-dependent oxidoreductase [Cytophagales bacterium]
MANAATHYDVIIIGGGASGLMCAMTAGGRGRRVLVLEGSNKVGKKILMSGGGRCNFTNLEVLPKNFISNNPRFCISALKRYTSRDFIALVEKHNIAYAERDLGKLFCLDSAKDILNMLLTEAAAASVEIQVGRKATSIKALQGGGAAGGFAVDEFTCESLVIASGGLSIPTMGASGFGYEVARQFGHTVLPTRAGLVPFTFSDKFKDVSQQLSGLAMDVDLSCTSASFNEAVLFTHRGLSGPAALQLSNYWQMGEPIALNLFPNESESELLDWLLSRKSKHPQSLLRTLLAEHPTVRLAKSLVLELQAALWDKYAECAIAQMPDAALTLIGQGLQAWQQKPSGTEGYRTAEVTLGGVDTKELSSKTMESSRQAGLYFVGEVVDVSGHLGGYNFQWAWASGHAAGEVV